MALFPRATLIQRYFGPLVRLHFLAESAAPLMLTCGLAPHVQSFCMTCQLGVTFGSLRVNAAVTLTQTVRSVTRMLLLLLLPQLR